MGEINSFGLEKPIAGILVSREYEPGDIISLMELSFGPADFISSVIPFSFTDYYNQEMGEGIRRLYISFRNLCLPDQLSRIKHQTNDMEKKYTRNGARKINIDPGLLSLTRLVLASTKDAGHRIPLQDGIFGEVTLIYKSGGFSCLDWTYPDYRSDFCREEMKKIREIFKKQIREAV